MGEARAGGGEAVAVVAVRRLLVVEARDAETTSTFRLPLVARAPLLRVSVDLDELDMLRPHAPFRIRSGPTDNLTGNARVVA